MIAKQTNYPTSLFAKCHEIVKTVDGSSHAKNQTASFGVMLGYRFLSDTIAKLRVRIVGWDSETSLVGFRKILMLHPSTKHPNRCAQLIDRGTKGREN